MNANASIWTLIFGVGILLVAVGATMAVASIWTADVRWASTGLVFFLAGVLTTCAGGIGRVE